MNADNERRAAEPLASVSPRGGPEQHSAPRVRGGADSDAPRTENETRSAAGVVPGSRTGAETILQAGDATVSAGPAMATQRGGRR